MRTQRQFVEGRPHDVDPRTYLRDVLLRIAKVSDVKELTPHGWKAKWAPIVEAHRASIVERIMLATKGGSGPKRQRKRLGGAVGRTATLASPS